MEDLFENEEELDAAAQIPQDAFPEDDGVSELMADTDRLTELGNRYIAEVEARAAEILEGAQAEAQHTTDALRQEVYEEIAAQKAEAEAYCQDKKFQAEQLIRDAEAAAQAAEEETREKRREAEESARRMIAEAQSEAARIVENAEAEAEEIRVRAEAALQEAKDARERAVYDQERIEHDGKEYLDVMENHAMARLDMISELLKNQQDWAFRAKQNIEELSGEIVRIREKYEEDYRY